MSNRVALVTGSSRGIGSGIALALAGAGFDVVINCQSNIDAAERVASQARAFGIRAEIVQGDISVTEDRAKIVAETERLFGRLDLLVNNAGVTVEAPTEILNNTEQSFDRIMNINVRGTYFLTQQVAKWMIRQIQTDPIRQPKIVSISSVVAFVASPNISDYCISKAALGMMTQVFAVRLAREGIGVFEIRPGVIETDITAANKHLWEKVIQRNPIRRWGTPDDIGKAVVAIAQGSFPYSTGQVIDVDGGIHIPKF